MLFLNNSFTILVFINSRLFVVFNLQHSLGVTTSNFIERRFQHKNLRHAMLRAGNILKQTFVTSDRLLRRCPSYGRVEHTLLHSSIAASRRSISVGACSLLRTSASAGVSKLLRSAIRQRLARRCFLTMAIEGSDLRWTELSVEGIEQETERIIVQSKQLCDQVGAVPLAEVRYDNVLKPLADEQYFYGTQRQQVTFPQHISTDQAIRDASSAADKKLSDYSVDKCMRQDLFERVCALQRNGADGWDPEARRLLERMVRDGRRNGLHLQPDVQAKLKALKKRESELVIDFEKNLNEVKTTFLLTKDELDGMPTSFIEGLDAKDGKYEVTLRYPHFFPIQKHCRRPDTRRLIEQAFNSRCKETNVKMLEELTEIRHEHAVLLGYASHSAYVLEVRMAKSPERVNSFLRDLQQKLVPLGEQELHSYRQYKREEAAAYRLSDADCQVIHMFDFRYYMTMLEQRQYSLDHETLREYFPCDKVVHGMLAIYQQLLGLKFDDITNADCRNVWNDDVTVWSVRDAADNSLMGYFYLDLYPRDGKFSHAACFVLQPGCLRPDGSRQVAVAALVANITKPSKDTPSLLTHDEVETLFHEFGHVMHDICAQAKFQRFSCASVERDFVECPSQILENWVWEEESLRLMSGHYLTGQPIPSDLLQALVKSRRANAGIFNLRQLTFALFDQTIHSQPKADTEADYEKLANEVFLIPPTAGTSFPATFAHMCDYDAQYYGYLWSEVFSADMFESRFKKEGLLNASVGADYRRKVLQPGGTIDGDEIVKAFLGREANMEPFLRNKGVLG